uniref:Uncharacterized protein n=1 Tax=Ananas comosus var. bracteatus TaxID=296719 RepID=A0A6V7PN89_ANACO|nr:unnamed protein product [Ananas comosus var. bracteatus]
MRSKNSNRIMEMEIRPNKLTKEEEPHLSGAYIRSLVKQLSSSRSKEPMKDEASQDHSQPQNQSPPPHPTPTFTTTSITTQEAGEEEAPHQQALPRKASEHGRGQKRDCDCTQNPQSSHEGAAAAAAAAAAAKPNTHITSSTTISKQHDMEWNDTVNLVTSAWWSKFLKKMEGGVEESRDGGERDDLHAIGEIFDVPPCFYEGFGLENKENNFMEQHLCDNYRNEDYSEDALPR